MNPGDLTIKLAAVLLLVAFVAAVRWARGREASRRTFLWAYHGMTALLVLAATLLMVAIVRHDFRYEYVINWSSRDLPPIYLVSSFWAGQEGSFLLWAVSGALVGYALFRRRSWEPAIAMAAYVPTVGFLLALMLDPAGNPFGLVAQVPPDGHGLNPLLQDPWMAIHPPLVFLGYVAMTIPAVLALVALIKRQDRAWLAPALRWSVAAFLVLGSGVVLGGFWAYKVLGWGGYWGWDPVENASLIPWLVGAALLHGLIVQQGSGALRRTNLVLALAGYVLVLYSTFLTRSGVLAEFSVHSFQMGSIYRILLAIMLISLAVSVVVFLRAKVKLGSDVPARMAWPFILSIAIVLIGVSAAFVFIGTSWPIISSAMGKASSPGISFYNAVNLPLYIALLAVLGFAPFLGWEAGPWKRLGVLIGPSLVVAAAGTALAWTLGGHGFGPLLLFFVALFALTSNVIRFVRMARVRWLGTGAALAHIGFALMFVGIVASSAWGKGEEARLPLGAPLEVMGMRMTFGGHVDGSEPQDRWSIEVARGGGEGKVIPAEVHMFRSGNRGGEDQYMHRPAILRSLAGDVYIAPQGLEVAGGNRQIELAKNQPTSLADATLTFLHFQTENMGEGHGMTVWSHVLVRRGGQEESLTLPFAMTGSGATSRPVEIGLMPGLTLSVQRMSVEGQRILVLAEDRSVEPTQILAVEVSTKPLVNLLWVGTLLLGLGCAVAVTRRWVDSIG